MTNQDADHELGCHLRDLRKGGRETMNAIVTCPNPHPACLDQHGVNCSHARPHRQSEYCERGYMCRKVDCEPVTIVLVKDERPLGEKT